MWSLNTINKQTNRKKKNLVDTENKLVVTRGEGLEGLGEKGEGIKKCKFSVSK